jgi:hypothetical protein
LVGATGDVTFNGAVGAANPWWFGDCCCRHRERQGHCGIGVVMGGKSQSAIQGFAIPNNASDRVTSRESSKAAPVPSRGRGGFFIAPKPAGETSVVAYASPPEAVN